VAALAKSLDHARTKGLSMLSTFSASLRRPATRVGVEAPHHMGHSPNKNVVQQSHSSQQ